MARGSAGARRAQACRNGFDILRSMRAHPRLADVPVLMLTSQTDEKAVGRGLQLAVNGYLSKPVSPKTLVASIIKCMD